MYISLYLILILQKNIISQSLNAHINALNKSI
jgi:hypothetical protein